MVDKGGYKDKKSKRVRFGLRIKATRKNCALDIICNQSLSLPSLHWKEAIQGSSSIFFSEHLPNLIQ